MEEPKLDRTKHSEALFQEMLETELPPAALSLLIKAETVVQKQLEAYNARDLEGWLATYKPDAEQYLLHAGLLASGHEAIRKRMLDRFNDPALHAELVNHVLLWTTSSLTMSSLRARSQAG